MNSSNYFINLPFKKYISVTNIIEHGYYTIYEKSCIVEIEN